MENYSKHSRKEKEPIKENINDNNIAHNKN